MENHAGSPVEYPSLSHALEANEVAVEHVSKREKRRRPTKGSSARSSKANSFIKDESALVNGRHTKGESSIDRLKSEATSIHDESTLILNGSAGTNFERFTDITKKKPRAGATEGVAKIKGLTLLDWLKDTAALVATNGRRHTSSESDIVPTTRDRASKRRRRDGASSSQRRNGSAYKPSSISDDYAVDSIRFAVDSAKLIPQGLVDRIDTSISHHTIQKIVDNHVCNWMSKAGFCDNFVVELTALLNAYYPCTHPTILDDVLVKFLFKSPYSMSIFLGVIIERTLKSSHVHNGSKVSLIAAFAKACAYTRVVQEHSKRHELSCLELLRYLLENNPSNFELTPWIAACLIQCTATVQRTCIRKLFNAWLDRKQHEKDSKLGAAWNLSQPLQQLCELLAAEEDALARCTLGSHQFSISCAYAEFILSDADCITLIDALFFKSALELYLSSDHLESQCLTGLKRLLEEYSGDQHATRLVSVLETLHLIVEKVHVRKREAFAMSVLQNRIFALVLHASSQLESVRKAVPYIVRHFIVLALDTCEDCAFEKSNSIGILPNGAMEATSKDLSRGKWRRKEYAIKASALSLRFSQLVTFAQSYEFGLLFVREWLKHWINTTNAVIPWMHVRAIAETAMNSQSSSFEPQIMSAIRSAALVMIPRAIQALLQRAEQEHINLARERISELLRFLFIHPTEAAHELFLSCMHLVPSQEQPTEALLSSFFRCTIVELLLDSVQALSFDSPEKTPSLPTSLHVIQSLCALLKSSAKACLQSILADKAIARLLIRLLTLQDSTIVLNCLELLCVTPIAEHMHISLLDAALSRIDSPCHSITNQALQLLHICASTVNFSRLALWQVLCFGVSHCSGRPYKFSCSTTSTQAALLDITCLFIVPHTSEYGKIAAFLDRTLISKTNEMNAFVVALLQRLLSIHLHRSWLRVLHHAFSVLNSQTSVAMQQTLLQILHSVSQEFDDTSDACVREEYRQFLCSDLIDSYLQQAIRPSVLRIRNDMIYTTAKISMQLIHCIKNTTH